MSALAPSDGNEDNQQRSGIGDEERRPDRCKTKTRQRETERCWLGLRSKTGPRDNGQAKHLSGEMRTRPRTTPGERTGKLKQKDKFLPRELFSSSTVLVGGKSVLTGAHWPGRKIDRSPTGAYESRDLTEHWGREQETGQKKNTSAPNRSRRGDDFCGRNQNINGSGTVAVHSSHEELCGETKAHSCAGD
jgi:hypothetical protein